MNTNTVGTARGATGDSSATTFNATARIVREGSGVRNRSAGKRACSTLSIRDLTRFHMLGQISLSRNGDWLAAVIKWADSSQDRWRTRLDVTDTGASHASRASSVSTDAPSCPSWSPAEDLLAYANKIDGARSKESIRLWTPRTGDSVELVSGLSRVSNLTWSPSGTELLFMATIDDEQSPSRPLEPRVLSSGVGELQAAKTGNRLYLANRDTGNIRALTGILPNVGAPSWSPDGRTICLAPEHRAEEDDVRIELLDLPSGAIRQIGGWSGPISWTGWLEDGRIIFTGQDAAGPCQRASLYAIDPCSGQITDLLAQFDRRILSSASGNPPAAVVVDSRTVLFSVYEGGCIWVYRLDLLDKSVRPWIADKGTVVQSISISADRSMLAMALGDTLSSGEVFIAEASSAEFNVITNLNSWANDMAVTAAEEISFDAPAGSLRGYLLRGRPVGESGPTLLEVHGGPDRAWRPSLSPHNLYRQELIDLGWNILLLNPRGSDGYGTRFMRSPLGRLGFSEEEDFLCAVDALIERGLAEEGKLALMGSSHGGFMTNWLTARTNRFAAGISMAGVANWTSLYGTSSHGPTAVPVLMAAEPWEAPSRYAECSPLTYARNVTTPTLIIHGEDDQMNPVGQSEEWYTALRRAGAEAEFVRYAGAGHLFMYNGRLSQQLDYMRRVVRWLACQVGKAGVA